MSTEIFLKGFFSALIGLALGAVVFFRDDSKYGAEPEASAGEKPAQKDGLEAANRERSASAGRQKYFPEIPAMLLPAAFLVIGAAAVCVFGIRRVAPQFLGMFLGIFLHMSVYFMILLAILPVLRKWISARTCALFWILPNFLYLEMASFMKIPEPSWVISLSEKWVWILFSLWFAGFAFVLIWKIVSHLVFRRRVLKGAEPVREERVLELLASEVRKANFKKRKFRLVRSPKVTTPLSLGLFHRSLRIVLPEKTFSDEEYRLIFRHELVHIGREDAWSKFFLVFCIAMCWFNPFMWIAGKKNAEDLELSCDEAVLLGGDAALRRRYAELLLETAGDDRGFTTCLSCAASTMRYRLKAVLETDGGGEVESWSGTSLRTEAGERGNRSRENLGAEDGEIKNGEIKGGEVRDRTSGCKPLGGSHRKKKHSGALAVALFFFALSMSCGYVTLAYGESTGEEKIFQGTGFSPDDLYRIRMEGGEYDPKRDFVDAAALYEYLWNLPLQEIVGNYSFPQDDHYMEFEFYRVNESDLGMIAQTDVQPPMGDIQHTDTQPSLEDDPHMDSELSAAQESAGEGESAFASTGEGESAFASAEEGESAFASTGFMLVRLSGSYVKVSPLHGEGGVYYLPEGVDWEYLDSICPQPPALEVRLFEDGDPYGKVLSPILTSLIWKAGGESRILKSLDPRETDRGIYSYRPIGIRAQLSFSMKPVSDLEVVISSWDWKSSETLIPSRQEDGVWTFPLPEDFAHYRIRGIFRDEKGAEFTAEFYFSIGNSEGSQEDY